MLARRKRCSLTEIYRQSNRLKRVSERLRRWTKSREFTTGRQCIGYFSSGFKCCRHADCNAAGTRVFYKYRFKNA